MTEFEDCTFQVFRLASVAMQSLSCYNKTTQNDNPLSSIVLKYPRFFYVSTESYLNNAITSLDCLFDTANKDNRCCFKTLFEKWSPIPDHVQDYNALKAKYEQLLPSAKAITVIRNNHFGHVAAWAKREEVEKKYEVKLFDLITLAYNALEVAVKAYGLIDPTSALMTAQDISLQIENELEAVMLKLADAKESTLLEYVAHHPEQ